MAQRPTFLTRIKNYNLRNQGWPAEFSCYPNEVGNGAPVITDPVFHTESAIGVYPSNADIIHLAKSTVAEDSPNIGGYSPWFLRKSNFGNTPAPKGHFILNAFNRNRQEHTGIAGTYDPARDQDPTRAVSVTFFAGRIFYLKPNGQVLFSQVLTDINRAGNCYQEADPTAEDINDLVATDGGVVNIRDIGEAYKLVSTNDRVYVFADNGVWYISGPIDSGFKATDFQVRQLTTAGCVGPNTVVIADSTVMFWGDSGIFAIVADPSTGQPVAQNITENTIQTFYNNIRTPAKATAQSFYDPDDRKIYWAYNNESGYDGISWRYKYNRILIFDIVLSAFYLYDFTTTYTINENNPGGRPVDAGGDWIIPDDITIDVTTDDVPVIARTTFDVESGPITVGVGSGTIISTTWYGYSSSAGFGTISGSGIVNISGTNYTISEFRWTPDGTTIVQFVGNPVVAVKARVVDPSTEVYWWTTTFGNGVGSGVPNGKSTSGSVTATFYSDNP